MDADNQEADSLPCMRCAQLIVKGRYKHRCDRMPDKSKCSYCGTKRGGQCIEMPKRLIPYWKEWHNMYSDSITIDDVEQVEFLKYLMEAAAKTFIKRYSVYRRNERFEDECPVKEQEERGSREATVTPATNDLANLTETASSTLCPPCAPRCEARLREIAEGVTSIVKSLETMTKLLEKMAERNATPPASPEGKALIPWPFDDPSSPISESVGPRTPQRANAAPSPYKYIRRTPSSARLKHIEMLPPIEAEDPFKDIHHLPTTSSPTPAHPRQSVGRNAELKTATPRKATKSVSELLLSKFKKVSVRTKRPLQGIGNLPAPPRSPLKRTSPLASKNMSKPLALSLKRSSTNFAYSDLASRTVKTNPVKRPSGASHDRDSTGPTKKARHV
ncbi:hypothetical protein AJ80_01477 [Polytolypa hystricis UAMH7299]|uniref:Uncharacterized protein n=1 Tax=Polytolypa hystricis (strain UAMH7299) TaxID=1447883 RepID=A0A2B7YZX4_POLH7|nr:hypothetical protein AJ80_01477 [Polytolypa hystricis UAMH7299]